jgi:glutathione S-transferase
VCLHLDTPGFVNAIARYSPAGRVPVLIDGDLHIWDSLAICEYANERCEGRLWPVDPRLRAQARAISAEIHAGFTELRAQWPMLSAATGLEVRLDARGVRDLDRIDAIWSDCRRAHAVRGPWLFGEFSIADAMYAPVTLRVRSYGALLSPLAQSYAGFVVRDSHMLEWIEAAARET